MTPHQLVIAIVMNIFVAPGAGQIYLKAKKRGWIFLLLAIGLIVAVAFHFALMMREMMEGLAPLAGNLVGLSQAPIENLMEKYGSSLWSYLVFLIVICVASIVDVVLIYLERNKRAPGAGITS